MSSNVSSQDSLNPYQSPSNSGASAPPQPGTALTRNQRRALEFYWKHRHRPPTTGRLLLVYGRAWLLLTVILALFAYVAISLSTRSLPQISIVALVAGMLIGIVVRDFAMIRQYVEIWPMLSALFKWDEVERLLERPGG